MEKIITGITAQKNNPKRCNLYLDGEFFCGIELITVMQNRLKVGQSIDEGKLDEILEDSEKEQAMNKALNFVSRGMHTEKQIAKYLKDKGYPGFIIHKVISRLKEVGYIDDLNFAKVYVSENKLSKGVRLIEYELKLKGVSEEIIGSVLLEFSEDEGAQNIAEKFFKNKEINYENITKCLRRLLSKGFDYDTAKQAIDSLKNSYEDN